MINKTIKNIQKIPYKVLEGLLTAKISKKILYKVLEGILTTKIANTKFLFFFVFPIYKRAKYKNGCYYQRNI